jgi:hypothetical protein
MPAFGILRQEDIEFEASLGYLKTPVSKKKKYLYVLFGSPGVHYMFILGVQG